MIDHRQIKFDPDTVEGLTLVVDQYSGLGIVVRLQGSLVIGSLAPESLYEAIFYRSDETESHRFFIPKCGFRFDPGAVGDRKNDPPPGSLIVAKRGISMIVRQPRGSPTTLALVGEPPKDVYDGICVTRWQVNSGEEFGDPQVICNIDVGTQT